ncbi:hypothetical protein IQ07DRAFT_592123 [Pyrenochaeta sp. DS3sAY3a]|nr:hypothetical protein IQ07DRAFT_592123 [Pyrenochaeta sp. DS3sAY3a]
MAKAFFEFDLSGPKSPLINNTPTPRAHENARLSSTANDATRKSNSRFLSLPTEIRLQIYEILLISRFDRTQNPSWAVGDTNQKSIMLHMIQARQYRTMEPSLLQTCKQVHREANPTLYSKNVFSIAKPAEIYRLVSQIGIENFSLIRLIQIWVPRGAKSSEWVQMLHLLAEKGTGLRCIEIAFDHDLESSFQPGLGDNQEIVRALGEIQGLDELVIKGYYAESWPAYLEKRMGAPVKAFCGHSSREKAKLKVDDRSDEELEHERFVHELNKTEVEVFREYQQRIKAVTLL